MSRSTQYIGLNSYAEKYVKRAEKTEKYHMLNGMFDEPISGSIFYMPREGDNQEIYKEVVQTLPWSSGMMIFTCLKLILVKFDGDIERERYNDDDDWDRYFEWMADPSLKEENTEVDYDTGRYYV